MNLIRELQDNLASYEYQLYGYETYDQFVEAVADILHFGYGVKYDSSLKDVSDYDFIIAVDSADKTKN